MTKHLSKLFWLFALALIVQACQTTTAPKEVIYNTSYDNYLSGFTQGEISKKSTIRVKFQQELTDQVAASIYPNPFSFEPAIAGEAVWSDKSTLEFVPAEDLTSGQIYTATLNMSKLIKDLPTELTDFVFQFKAKDQFINVSPLANTVTYNEGKKLMTINGQMELHDAEDISKVEKLLEVYDGDQKLPIDWKHQNGKSHTFAVAGVEQKNNAYNLVWKWNGETVQSKTVGNYTTTIPSDKEFKVNKTYQFTRPEQHVIIEFSDLLSTNQNLEGLLLLDGKKLKYTIDNNKIKLYTNGNLTGKKQLKISQLIQNLAGKPLGTSTTTTILFDDVKPEVKWIGNGNIIPKSKKMPIVFQSVNLSGIDVRVIKVKEANVKQFFQVNQIADDKELKRVGNVVLEKKIAFDDEKLNLTTWTTHSLDLADLITPEPGAIYEIAIGFRQSYSLYNCTVPVEEEANREEINMMQLPEKWDEPNYNYSYWDFYEDDYNYENLQNPCSRYYYAPQKAIKRNILASDLGIIAKQGSTNNLFVVSDLQTTKPMKGVLLEFYDYHQELIGTATTDKDGMATTKFDKNPFFLIAKQDKQRGYMRLDDGSALSMSRFDVSGNTYHKGLKGFIYGERGVWRPGDELFINFILEDKDKTLPAIHPVRFSLKDSKGSLVYSKMTTAGINGIYNFTCQTSENAPTGNYLATVTVGGASFSKTIRIEAVKPNRLKMTLDFGKQELALADKEVIGTLQANWLHGAAAQNLKAKVEMTLKAKNVVFPMHSGFTFNDAGRDFDPEDKVIFEDKLDENGAAKVKTTIAAKAQSPGMLQADFRMKVFEPGGDFSIGQSSIPYHPYTTYVGVRLPKGDESRNMLLTDKKHPVEIITVDKDGKAKDVENLIVTLYKLEWKWWFDKNKEEVPNYRGRINASEVETAVVSTKNGKAIWDLEIKYPQWGRYFVRVQNGKKGHSTGQVFYIDWPGWAGRSTEKSGGATALRFSADQEKYNVGQEISLNIPTGFEGRALVSIENGTSVIEAHWLEAKKGNTTFKFKATKAMAPNAYATVTLIQPHAQTKNDLPIRMYGVIPLQVEDPTTHLQPEIVMSDELRPEQDFSISVKEQKGGPMAYTIAIVDEGLLGLTNYKTPNPWPTFYQREALGVKTWDIYDDVLGAFGGDIKSLLSIGGDAADNAKGNKKINRFKPVVLYAGPFYLKAGETMKHNFKMPNYVGAVRAMVVASHQGAYGAAEKEVPVRQPLMVLGTVPRLLGVGEQFKLPVTVFAMKENIKDVQVTVLTNGLIDIDGSSTKVLKFDKVGDQIVNFELNTKEQVGTGNIKIIVRSGDEMAVYETDVELRNANPRETLVESNTLEDKKDWKTTYKPLGMLGTNNGMLEVSSIPPINLGKRLAYLIRYPYGCVEQTTSSVYPQLQLAKLMKLSDENKQKIDKNIKAGIERLYRFQTNDGAMGYWMGATKGHEWATNYAGNFMIEAEKAGYSVRADFFKNWVAYQSKTAKSWTAKGTVSDDLTQAYRLYLLALHGKAEMGAMNRMRLKQMQKESVTAQWYLAAAYHLAGQKGVAKQIASKATTRTYDYENNTGATTFGSQFRDQSLILQTLSIMEMRDQASELVQAVSERLSSDQWCSTQETAQALIAIAKFVGSNDIKDNINFEYQLAGGSWQKATTDKPIWQLELNGEQATKVALKNSNGSVLFARVIADGIPANQNETESNKGLEMTLKYVDMLGKEIDSKKIKQGTDFKVQVTVKNIGLMNYNELAIHHVFPAGWEIHNARLTGATTGGDEPEYQDIRDDRVYTFFDLRKNESKTFHILLNASYLGKYYLPAVSVEAMYDKAIHARKRGHWTTVAQDMSK